MKGLYAIVDTKLLSARKTDPVEFARAVLTAHPAALQVRAKDLEARALLGLLRVIAPLCRQARVPLVVNDRADLAVLGGCDAVHIGQEDLPYPLIHRIAPQLGVGISTHDPEQLARAVDAQPRYVAYGPVFGSPGSRAPVGIDGLEAAVKIARRVGIPVVATGGIVLADVPRIGAIADACAVIGDLYPPGATMRDVRDRAHAFQVALATARGEPCPLRTPTPGTELEVRSIEGA